MRKCMLLCSLVFVLFSGSLPASSQPSAALLEDAQSYAKETGTTVEEAVRRLQLQHEIGDLNAALLAEEPATFAGLRIEHKPQYRVVARFTDPAAEARLRARVAGGTLNGLVETRSARWSLAELEKRRGEVRGHARRANIRTNSEINITENRVEVYVLDPEKLTAALGRARARIPEGVLIVRVPRLAQPQTLTGAASLTTCTAGFTVQAPNGELGISTAGHCGNNQSFQRVPLPLRRERDGGAYDVQWHSACDLFPVTNQFESGFGLRPCVGTRHRDHQAEGTWVCKFGGVTGRTCGLIDSTSHDPDGWLDLNPFDGTYVRVDGLGKTLSKDGDSGAPWFVWDVAYGIHKGSPFNEKDAVYMAINYLSGIGVSVLTSNPGICNLVPVARFTGGARIDGTASFDGSTSSDPDGRIVRWEWNFDDGTTGVSTTPLITHVYPRDSGSYFVQLTVTDNEGKRASVSREICVPATSCVTRPLG